MEAVVAEHHRDYMVAEEVDNRVAVSIVHKVSKVHRRVEVRPLEVEEVEVEVGSQVAHIAGDSRVVAVENSTDWVDKTYPLP